MQTPFDNTLDELIKAVPSCNGLAVSLSGGVDSMVLLQLAHNYAKRAKLPLCAVHIHHGLSANADAWLTFAQQQCARQNITFFSRKVTLSSAKRKGVEAKAREARYRAIDELTPKGHAILLGQHQDDQVETFFLRLKRGAGVKGLGAMKALSVWHQRVLFRPLLTFSRAQLELWAKQHGVEHIHDESNDDSEFDRNFLRNDVLPLLNNRFQGFNLKVAQTAKLLQTQQQLLDDVARGDLQPAHINAKQVNAQVLLSLGSTRCINALRYWLEQQSLQMPSQAQLEQFVNQLSKAGSDTQPELTLKSHTAQRAVLRRYHQSLYLIDETLQPQPQVILARHGDTQLADGRTLRVSAGKGIREPMSSEKVSIKFAQLSARIRPGNKPYSNKLSHWLKELKVPPWQRQTIPLIFYDETLVAVVGYFYNHEFEVTEGLQWQLITQNHM